MDYLTTYLHDSEKAMRSHEEAANIIAVRTAIVLAWSNMSTLAQRRASAYFDALLIYREMDQSIGNYFHIPSDVERVINETGSDEAKLLVEQAWSVEGAIDDLSFRTSHIENNAAHIVRKVFGIEHLAHHDYDFSLIYNMLKYNREYLAA